MMTKSSRIRSDKTGWLFSELCSNICCLLSLTLLSIFPTWTQQISLSPVPNVQYSTYPLFLRFSHPFPSPKYLIITGDWVTCALSGGPQVDQDSD